MCPRTDSTGVPFRTLRTQAEYDAVALEYAEPFASTGSQRCPSTLAGQKTPKRGAASRQRPASLCT